MLWKLINGLTITCRIEWRCKNFSAAELQELDYDSRSELCPRLGQIRTIVDEVEVVCMAKACQMPFNYQDGDIWRVTDCVLLSLFGRIAEAHLTNGFLKEECAVLLKNMVWVLTTVGVLN